MATEKLGASILESRLGSLKKDFEGVKSLLDDLNNAAGSFGTTLTHSIRNAKGELHGLESALKGLETQLKRTSTTGSAIGAANISSSLSQLTGQGRTYGGGGGYGGAGGGGGPANYGLGPLSSGGGGGGGSIFQPRTWWGRALAGLTGFPLKLAQMQGGMAWGAMKQAHGVRQQWEQAARYTRGLRGATRYGGIAGVAQLGVSQFEGAGTLRELQSRFGYARPRGGYGISNIHRLAQSSGIEPGEWLSMMEAGRTGGMGVGEGYNLSRGLLMGAREDVIQQIAPNMSRDPNPILRFGKNLGAWWNNRLTPAQINAVSDESIVGPRAQYIARARMAGVSALQAQQIAGTGRMSQERGDSMVGFVRGLTQPDGVFGGREQIGARMAAALGGASAAPGGGEAGQLFMMRAAGFGNPMLEEYRRNAQAMGVDPSIFQRRNFLESKLFLEDDPVRRIQAMMVGIQSEYGPGRGTGYKESQILALEALAGKEGVTFSLAKDLMSARGKDAWSTQRIRELGAKHGVDFEARDKLPGERPLGGGALILEQMSKYEAATISLGKTVAIFSKALNDFNIKSLRVIAKEMSTLNKSMRKIRSDKTYVEAFWTPLKSAIAMLKETLEVAVKKAP